MENTKIGPKDVFFHLLAIVTLYASAISLTVLLFQYINLAFPAVDFNAFYYRDNALSGIRHAVSTLIVVFPVYFYVSRLLRKMYEADQERRNLGIRRWLSYFTLFLSAGISIGWLVGVINQFLEGDLTTAFLLKALVIFFVAGSTAFYYRAVIRGEENTQKVRMYAYVVAAVILAAIVSAFFVVGSPNAERVRKMDSMRVDNLMQIQNYVTDSYMAKGTIPASLDQLNDPLRGVSIPKDPKTEASYEYVVKGPLSFDLCANFDLEAKAGDGASDIRVSSAPYPMKGGVSWEHPAGHYCFTRTIDKDFFKGPGIPTPMPVTQ
jgi:hypothetical protein